MGDVEAQPVAVQQVQPQVRPMIGPGGVGLDIAPEPQTMVQNATGAVQVGGNRNGMGMGSMGSATVCQVRNTAATHVCARPAPDPNQ